MNRAIIIAACLSLGACATAGPPLDPKLEVKTVPMVIVSPCTPDIGPEPDYVDSDAALKSAPDLFAQVKLLLAGRLQRIKRDAEKSAALAKCAA